jgi:hypothetical protein
MIQPDTAAATAARIYDHSSRLETSQRRMTHRLQSQNCCMLSVRGDTSYNNFFNMILYIAPKFLTQRKFVAVFRPLHRRPDLKDQVVSQKLLREDDEAEDGCVSKPRSVNMVEGQSGHISRRGYGIADITVSPTLFSFFLPPCHVASACQCAPPPQISFAPPASRPPCACQLLARHPARAAPAVITQVS